ncbi:microphthalmia-associated transcription factor-like isoform X2 [Ptychodera flava]|uniref:microphthalmia-associated transcription factor-like isoform X2 n=1 Tax=Ptychodera flava TaxID=63121 RepID=UPI00396AA669
MSASTEESGIDLDFELPSNTDDLLKLERLSNTDTTTTSGTSLTSGGWQDFYELKSAPIDDILSSSKKRETNLNPMTSRTNLKQQLMRQQQLQEDEREMRAAAMAKAASITQSQTVAVEVPTTTLAPIPEVPKQILQVNTRLMNPTRFHVQQRQKQQLKDYLSQSQSPVQNRLSLPQTRVTPPLSPSQYNGQSQSVPDSPMSVNLSSSAQSTELDEFLEDVLSLGSSLGEDLLVNTLEPLPATLPTTNLLDLAANVKPVAIQNTSQSCPTESTTFQLDTDLIPLTEEQVKALAKDRQKKDNHNMIERRRRFNINDRIQELGTLLPKNSDPDQRMNKGTILKSSVDYIKKLRRETDKMKHVEMRSKSLENINRKMLLRIQELEMHCRAHGITPTPLSSDTSTANITEEFLRQQPPLSISVKTDHQNQSTYSTTPTNSSLVDELMDDSTSPITNDPLLSAPSPMEQSTRNSVTSLDDLHDTVDFMS